MFSKSRIRYVYIFFYLTICCLAFVSCKAEEQQQNIRRDSSKVIKADSTSLRKVTLQLQWLHQAQFAGFYVAKEKGIYSEYGLDVIIEMGGPQISSPHVISNKGAEFGTMFLTSALREVDAGNKIVNIAQLSQKSSMLLVARKNSGIEKISDINGKRVGLWASDFNEPSIIFLNKNNIKAKIVPISWTTNVLSQGVVDIMNMMVYNEYNVYINSGNNPEDLSVFALHELGVNIPEDGVYCHSDYYAENQSLCHDFAEATMDGWFYALNHEEETLSYVLKYLKDAHLPANIPHQQWMLQKIKEAILFKPEQFGKLTKHDYYSSVQMMEKNGMLKKHSEYLDFIGYADIKKD